MIDFRGHDVRTGLTRAAGAEPLSRKDVGSVPHRRLNKATAYP
jgi:hypothetical protein